MNYHWTTWISVNPVIAIQLSTDWHWSLFEIASLQTACLISSALIILTILSSPTICPDVWLVHTIKPTICPDVWLVHTPIPTMCPDVWLIHTECLLMCDWSTLSYWRSILTCDWSIHPYRLCVLTCDWSIHSYRLSANRQCKHSFNVIYSLFHGNLYDLTLTFWPVNGNFIFVLVCCDKSTMVY